MVKKELANRERPLFSHKLVLSQILILVMLWQICLPLASATPLYPKHSRLSHSPLNLVKNALVEKPVNELPITSSNSTATDKTMANTSSSSAYAAMQLSGDVAVVRHGFNVNGSRIEGSVRQLLGESTTLNSGAVVTGDIYVPGTPNITNNGSNTYNGTVVGTGANSPSGYSVTLNSSIKLRHIYTKTDAITMPTVSAPPSPTGTVDVNVNQPNPTINFSTLRNLTLNSSVGDVAVPAGTYGTFIANNNSNFVFGDANSSQPITYNLQSLTLNSVSQLKLVGPVTLNVANSVFINNGCIIGSANFPLWLSLNVSGTSGVTLNSSNSALYGSVLAPNSTVTINSNTLIKGQVIANRLILNGSNAILRGFTVDTIAPTVTISSPHEGDFINAGNVTVQGTVTDDSATSVTVNGVTTPLNGNNYSTNISLVNGANTITVVATDALGNVGQAVIHVTRGVAPTNTAPVVNAGADLNITLPNSAIINGTVTDDGLPNPPALVTITWSKVSGPGTVTFSNPNTASTTANFSQAGTYVLRLTASDSALSASDDVTVTVSAQNQAPVVNAGADQTISLPNNATLNGSVTDDGLPNNSLTISWSKVSGPGTVTFGTPNQASTTASFSQAGTYVLRLTGNDSALSTSDDLQITVTPPNQAPIVDAGIDQTISLPANATLTGSVTDDGLPNNNLTITWSKVSGPGTVTFSSPNTAATQASFSLSGVYTLRLTANDGALSSSDDVVVSVNAGNQAPTVNAGDAQNIAFEENLIINGSNEVALVNGEITSWTEVQGTTWTQANAGVNGLPPAYEGNTYFSAGSEPSAELRQDIDVAAFASAIDAGTQSFAFRGFVRSANETPADGATIIVEYRDATNTTVLASYNSGVITSINQWQLLSDSRLAPTGTRWVRVRLMATLNSGTTNDAFFDGLTLRPVNSSVTILSGTASDDGLPSNTLTTTWSKVSGPGNITFVDASQLQTKVIFDAVGTYLLRLTADDSLLTSTDDLTITITNANTAPVVNAGVDQTITLPAIASLNGIATDDGLPAGSSLTYSWSKVSGPGTVSFTNNNSAITDASFSIDGVYTLRLTVSDGQLSSSDEVIITVNAAVVNQPPVVNAGQDQSITLPNIATLNGTVTDDGLPTPPAHTTITWSMVSGPGVATFANPSFATTTVSFTVAGSYILRLTANDGEFSVSDEIEITVIATNQAPLVNAGEDQNITLPANITLAGQVTDDGLPTGNSLFITWAKVSGPEGATVSFENANAATTAITVDTPGVYVFRLTASDGELSSQDDVTVTITQRPIIPIFSFEMGFNPSELSVTAGAKLLMLRNRTGIDNLTYVITQGSQSSTVNVGLGASGFVYIDLVPGEVTITEQHHPEWQSVITVMP